MITNLFDLTTFILCKATIENNLYLLYIPCPKSKQKASKRITENISYISGYLV